MCVCMSVGRIHFGSRFQPPWNRSSAAVPRCGGILFKQPSVPRGTALQAGPPARTPRTTKSAPPANALPAPRAMGDTVGKPTLILETAVPGEGSRRGGFLLEMRGMCERADRIGMQRVPHQVLAPPIMGKSGKAGTHGQMEHPRRGLKEQPRRGGAASSSTRRGHPQSGQSHRRRATVRSEHHPFGPDPPETAPFEVHHRGETPQVAERNVQDGAQSKMLTKSQEQEANSKRNSAHSRKNARGSSRRTRTSKPNARSS